MDLGLGLYEWRGPETEEEMEKRLCVYGEVFFYLLRYALPSLPFMMDLSDFVPSIRRTNRFPASTILQVKFLTTSVDPEHPVDFLSL